MELKKITQQVLVGATIFAAGVVSANTWLSVPTVTAQQTKPPTAPQAFLAGDERTEPVIREILVTIKKMDARLANIEKSVTGAKKPSESGEPTGRSRPRQILDEKEFAMLGLGQSRKLAAETPLRGALLGLDLGAFSLKAARISSSKAGTRLEQVRCVTYSQPLTANDASASLDRIAIALKEAGLQGSRWRPTPIACTLPLCMTQMRLLDAPSEEGVDEEDYILRELAAEDNNREEPWLGDHWPTQSSAAAEAHAPMGIVGARRGWVEELIACFEEIGLEPRIIDGAPFTIARALRKSESRNDDVQAGLDLGYECALFVLVRRGVPTYFRVLRGCGMRGVLEAIRNGLHIEEREAHQFLKACAQASRRPSAASKTMINTLMELTALPLRRLQNELARTLDFARRQSDANELKRITLFGGGALFPGMASLLEGWADLDFRQFTLKLDPLSETDGDLVPLLAHAVSLAEISTSA